MKVKDKEQALDLAYIQGKLSNNVGCNGGEMGHPNTNHHDNNGQDTPGSISTASTSAVGPLDVQISIENLNEDVAQNPRSCWSRFISCIGRAWDCFYSPQCCGACITGFCRIIEDCLKGSNDGD